MASIVLASCNGQDSDHRTAQIMNSSVRYAHTEATYERLLGPRDTSAAEDDPELPKKKAARA